MARIERTASGYRTRVYLGRDSDGKKLTKVLTDTDKQRLKRRAAEYVETYSGEATRDTFGTALDAYIKARVGVLSPSTIRGYNSMASTLKSLPGLCDRRLTDISEADIRMVVSRLSDRSPKTLRNITGLISAVMTFHGLPMPSVRLPAKQVQSRDIPDPETMARILAAAKGTRMEVPLGLAAMGLRRSEICGLSITDLDKNGVLHIHRGAVYGEGFELVVKDTVKNASSDRYIQLPPQLASTIRKQGYVTDMTPSALSNAVPHFLRSNGFPIIRLHDFRHFMASYLHSLGIPDAEILRMGGWRTDNVMKSVYRHALAQEETAKKVSGAYEDWLT